VTFVIVEVPVLELSVAINAKSSSFTAAVEKAGAARVVDRVVAFVKAILSIANVAGGGGGKDVLGVVKVWSRLVTIAPVWSAEVTT
jgi:hypothetical protein